MALLPSMRATALVAICVAWSCRGRRARLPEERRDVHRAARHGERLPQLLLPADQAAGWQTPIRGLDFHSLNSRLPSPARPVHMQLDSESDESEEMPSDIDVDVVEEPSDIAADVVDVPSDVETEIPSRMSDEPAHSELNSQNVQQQLLTLGAATARGEAASADEKLQATQAVELLEESMPAIEITDGCLGTWELVMSDTQLFRSSPFFMAGRATCKDGEEARQYNWFCDMHREALRISQIQRVRQVVSPSKIVSEFEVAVGAVPFVGDYFNIKYSGGLPLKVTGSIVSSADIESTEGNAWRLFMDTVEIKGSNIPGLREALDNGVKLQSRDLGNFLEETVSGYSNPKPEFRVTYLDEDFRISRDQDNHWFVYVRTSKSQEPKDYSSEPADLGVGNLIGGLQQALLR